MDKPEFSLTLKRYCSLSVVFDGLIASARERGLIDELGNPRGVTDAIRRLGQTLLAHERELLLTPLSFSAARPRNQDVFEQLIHSVDDAEVVDAPEAKADGRRLS
ncbi:MAG: hypothetical protein WCA22_00705 [Candidatus Binatus sp.]